ncbi:putative tranposase protein [Gluconacetobacter diazotrophicus PA1 5]|uniref:Putative tranposase protein n=1 Tax=Gluconacetobacter diazotrophicus (strain ATCC 49037 / DSM 5601 / CCUG 37298 / CIP 103539 / LMG 7603 / PAl5) TaxID=272568 RepID=A9HH23_GLUDA|nr:putative tranposase protein [Gluconacetobacter diazotrophicus PA1 5]
MRRLDALAVDHSGRRAGFTARALPVKHQFHIMNGLEQEPPGQFPEPTIDRTPMPEMDRQHSPVAAGSNQVTNRVDHLAEFDLARTPRASRLGHQWRDARPFLLRHIRRK